MDKTAQHVAEMQKGTPLLLRKLSENGGQESLQIYVFQIDINHKFLKWTETDGSKVCQVAIGSIADVSEDEDCPSSCEDEGGCLRVSFPPDNKGSEPLPMDLIFASKQDLIAWRDGLRFLVDKARSNGSRSPGPSPSAAKAAAKRPRTAGAAVSGAETSAGVGQLVERIRLQEELIVELREENGVLNEIVKQKDDIVKQKDLAIEHLMHELKNRGTKAEQCHKTESTSRESDDHLRDRETAILKRKNLRLQKLVRKRDQTIKNLMVTLQTALGGQTSDGDMLRTEDDNDEEVDSDEAPGSPQAALAAARALGQSMQTDSGSEPEAIREEVRALTRESPRQSPSSAAARAAAAAAAGKQLSPSAKAHPDRLSEIAMRKKMAAAAQAQGMASFDFSAVGGAPAAGRGSMSKDSKSALEVLSREMQVLEEKKRAVEELARHLEPPSDNEDEDDGFPLQ